MLTQKLGNETVLVYEETDPLIEKPEQALDLIGACYGTEITMITVPAKRLSDGFFTLRTGFAGEVFQKFQTYRLRLVIVGDITRHLERSDALKDFVRETNRAGYHLFLESETALTERLAAAG